MFNRQVQTSPMKDIEVLVVDDTVANLDVLDEILSSAQYRVSAVTSGKRALKQLQEQTPALILLDVQMPEMNGFETCRQIKANPDTANIPVVFITALSDVESIVKGFSLGAVDYITKPFRETELLARVRTQINLYLLTEKLEEQVVNRTAELKTALERLEHFQMQTIQSEKMAALGNLVAGIAHEINNPIGFLNGSIHNAQNYVQDLQGQLALYQQYHPDAAAPIQENAEAIDLAFICEDLPKLLTSMEGATDRITAISTSLRTFSRADTEYKVSADIQEGLDSTLLILKYRLKADSHRPEIQVIKDYSKLPAIDCFPGRLNQVFMNLLANAIDVFDESAEQASFAELQGKPQIITVKTAVHPELKAIEIRISDNGKGMSADVSARIFDHLFTTKGVGKGTGLGLAIAQQIVVGAHGGKLEVQSEPGQGTEFCIQLPL